MAFSPDGRTLAAAGTEGTLFLWDLTDRAHPTRLGELLAPAVTSVAFSPDGRTLAISGSNGTVALWSVAR